MKKSWEKGGIYLLKETKDKLLRMELELFKDIEKIAEKENTNVNQTIETACKFYRDMHYMENSATFINEEILKVIKSTMDLLLHQVNHKTNKVLSELAIQNVIQNLILASELEVNDLMVDEYRKQAIDFLRTNNRVLRLDELTN